MSPSSFWRVEAYSLLTSQGATSELLAEQKKCGVTIKFIPPTTEEFLIFLPKVTLCPFEHHGVGTVANGESNSHLINEITFPSFGL